MDAVLRIAAARRYDLSVVAEPLPAAEAGLVEARSSDRVHGLAIEFAMTGLEPGPGNVR